MESDPFSSIPKELTTVIINLTYDFNQSSTFSLLLVNTQFNTVISELLRKQMESIRLSISSNEKCSSSRIGNGKFAMYNFKSPAEYSFRFAACTFIWQKRPEDTLISFKYNYAGIEHDVLPHIYSYVKEICGDTININLDKYVYCACYHCNVGTTDRHFLSCTPIIHSVTPTHTTQYENEKTYSVVFQVHRYDMKKFTGEVHHYPRSEQFGIIKNANIPGGQYPVIGGISGNYQWLMNQKIATLG